MPSPNLTFAATLQDAKRLPQGTAFGGVLEEVIQVIPFMRLDAPGESLVVSRCGTPNQVAVLAGWKAPGATPTVGTPTASSFTFTFRRMNSLSQDDPTVALANRDPNDFLEADLANRRTAMLRNLGLALMVGADDDTTGFLGWENMTAAAGNRTDVTAGAATAAGVLEALLRIDDSCASGPLGARATAFVTTQLGRRNIERAAQLTGFDLVPGRCGKLLNEVPYYRGRPIVVSSGLTNDAINNVAPLYAVDFTYVFLVASTGQAEDHCIEEMTLPLQESGSQGTLLWFHGACVVRQASALVRTTITTTLSA